MTSILVLPGIFCKQVRKYYSALFIRTNDSIILLENDRISSSRTDTAEEIANQCQLSVLYLSDLAELSQTRHLQIHAKMCATASSLTWHFF